MTDQLFDQWDEAFVAAAVAAVSRSSLWSDLEKIASWKRESGSADERAAAAFVAARLREMGLAVQVYEPELYISSPQRARLTVISTVTPWDIECKAAAFSGATDGLEADVVHVPYEKDKLEKDTAMAGGRDAPTRAELRGKIVLTEKLFMPPKVLQHQRAGAVGQIYAKPGEILHEQGASAVWGNPTPKSVDDLPRTPVLSIKKSDGDRLAALCASASASGAPLRVRIETAVDQGWRRCPIVVGGLDDDGTRHERFLLLHAHLDSWHWGVGDNGTGDATLLELARVFAAPERRARLRHGLRVAFWPGHFKGHYAGSAWYADAFAIELYERCLAHVDIDSPGCRWATDFSEHAVWMKEAEEISRSAIRAITGQHAPGARPLRAGDFSFNQIGVSGLMKMLSNIPAEVRREKGFHYFVGGCGGNPVWHTEADTLATADPDHLERDARIYAHAVARLLTARVLPLDYRATAREIEVFLESYQTEAGAAFDLGPAIEAARALTTDLCVLYQRVEEVLARCRQPSPENERATRSLNDALVAIARQLVPVNYAAGERFEHDLGVPLWPVPRLAGVKKLAAAAAKGEHHVRLWQTLLVRERNAVVHALREAARLARGLTV